MNCRRAERLISRRGELRPDSALDRELERHLRGCRSCRQAAEVDRQIVRGLTALRGRIPYTVDVRRRVMAEIEELGSVPRHDVSVRELGWATAAALIGLFGLAAVVWVAWPSWPGTGSSLAALRRGTGELMAVVWNLLAAVFSLPLKLLVLLDDAVFRVGPWLEGLEPLALVAIAACYLLMGLTILHFVGRDLRTTRALHTNGD